MPIDHTATCDNQCGAVTSVFRDAPDDHVPAGWFGLRAWARPYVFCSTSCAAAGLRRLDAAWDDLHRGSIRNGHDDPTEREEFAREWIHDRYHETPDPAPRGNELEPAAMKLADAAERARRFLEAAEVRDNVRGHLDEQTAAHADLVTALKAAADHGIHGVPF